MAPVPEACVREAGRREEGDPPKATGQESLDEEGAAKKTAAKPKPTRPQRRRSRPRSAATCKAPEGRPVNGDRRRGRVHHHRRRPGAGVGVVAGRARSAQRLGEQSSAGRIRTRYRSAANARRGRAAAGGGRATRRSSSKPAVRTGPSFRCACSGCLADCRPGSKVVGLLSGRDTYRPPEMIQRRILRRDPARARVVAGEPAKVSELRQQWRSRRRAKAPGNSPVSCCDAPSLAIERIELRLLGPEYKSPRLVKAGNAGIRPVR